jgi:hypothetical protein
VNRLFETVHSHAFQSKSWMPLATSSSCPLISIPIKLLPLPPLFDDDDDAEARGVGAASDSYADSDGEANSINLTFLASSVALSSSVSFLLRSRSAGASVSMAERLDPDKRAWPPPRF